MTLSYYNGEIVFTRDFDFRNLEELHIEYDKKHQFMKQNYKLPKLKILDYNVGWEKFPSCVWTYTNIEKLTISYTSEDSLSHINELSKLQELTIHNSYLRKAPLFEYEKLPDLKKLCVFFSIHGSTEGFMEHIFAFKNLEVLYLTGSAPKNFEGISKLENLKTLSLHASDLRNIPEEIFELKKLEELDLSWNFSLTALPNKISELKHLRYLNIDAAYELKRLPESICTLSLLDTLIITDCVKLEKLPGQIGNLKQLKVFEFTGCRKLKELPESFGMLESIKTLAIQVSGNKLPENIGSMKNLKKLTLDYNGKVLPESFSNLGELEELNTFACKKLQMSKNCRILSKCSKLKTLITILNENKFPDEWIMMNGIKNLGVTVTSQTFNWRTANVLILNDSITQLCVLSDKIDLPNFLNAIAGSQVHELRLGSLITTIPKEIGLMRNLRILDLSNNKIESIHEFIGMLTQLEELDLSGQYTPGRSELPGILHLQSLPKSIGKLQKLKTLHFQPGGKNPEEYMKQLKRELPNCEIVPF